MDMRFPHVFARLISMVAVVTSFSGHALATDVTLRLVDQKRVPIPASVFVIDGTPVAQDGVIALSEGIHTVTAFPGKVGAKVGGAETTGLYCAATLKISGATQLIELAWRTTPATEKVPECALVTAGHFTLTVADDGSWTYRPGRPVASTTPPLRGDPAVVELAGQIAGITRVMASPGDYDPSAQPYWQVTVHSDGEWMNSAFANLATEAKVFLERARLLKRDDPELLERFVSLQTRLQEASLPMSLPESTDTSGSTDATRRALFGLRFSSVAHMLAQMERLLAPPL
jgi:hypothetical protein